MEPMPFIDTEILIGFYRYHPAMEAEGLYALRVLTCRYTVGNWIHANRYIQKRIKELWNAHGGKVEELDRRLATANLPWSTDPGYRSLFNPTPANVPAHLLDPIIVPDMTGVDCSKPFPGGRVFRGGENSDIYPGMP